MELHEWNFVFTQLPLCSSMFLITCSLKRSSALSIACHARLDSIHKLFGIYAQWLLCADIDLIRSWYRPDSRAWGTRARAGGCIECLSRTVYASLNSTRSHISHCLLYCFALPNWPKIIIVWVWKSKKRESICKPIKLCFISGFGHSLPSWLKCANLMYNQQVARTEYLLGEKHSKIVSFLPKFKCTEASRWWAILQKHEESVTHTHFWLVWKEGGNYKLSKNMR